MQDPVQAAKRPAHPRLVDKFLEQFAVCLGCVAVPPEQPGPASRPTSSEADARMVEGPAADVAGAAAANSAPKPKKAADGRVSTHVAYEDGKYRGAPLPPNEPERMQYLCGLNVLDTAPDQRFDEITKLASAVFKVPVALVSLVDKDRQWFKSVVGLPGVDHTDRKSSFCAWTLLPQAPEVLVVKDAVLDARFVNNPLVTGPPGIRFYAGCPLVVPHNGIRLGSLCIIDMKPREFDAEACMMLSNMAQMVVRELEKDKALAEQQQMSAALTQEKKQLMQAMNAFTEGILLCNVNTPGWAVEFANEPWADLTGFSKADMAKGFWSVFKIPDGDVIRVQTEYQRAIAAQKPFELVVYAKDAAARPRAFTLQLRCANVEGMDSFMPLVGAPARMADSAIDLPTYYYVTLNPNLQVNTTPTPSRHPSSTGRTSYSSAVGYRPLNLLGEGGGPDPFGDVKLGQLLGRGSFGRVYRGRWNGSAVAIKVLEYEENLNGEPDEEHAKGQVEALLSTQLSHPHVVQSYKHCTREVGRYSNGDQIIFETWIVMEFCNRGSVWDAVERGLFRKAGDMWEPDWFSLVATAKEIASAMAYLHSLRILHGDLTSSNVMLSGSHKDKRQFVAKVCDFGLSRPLESATVVATKSMGTITHMPPEVVLDGKHSLPADVYAFGVIVWEMYTGQKPWHGFTQTQIIHAISTGKQLPLDGNCPTALRKFLQRCLAPKPADRPTFAEAVADLEELEDELVGTTGDFV